jgi:hypothetical protein
MIQVSIIKESQITNQASFPSQEEAQAWLSRHEAMGTFGTSAHVVQQQVEIFPAVIDEEGNEISPAQFETQDFQIPATYQVEIVDISAQMAQEATNAAALKMLADTDWMIVREMEGGVACPQEIKDARAAARASIVR